MPHVVFFVPFQIYFVELFLDVCHISITLQLLIVVLLLLKNVSIEFLLFSIVTFHFLIFLLHHFYLLFETANFLLIKMLL